MRMPLVTQANSFEEYYAMVKEATRPDKPEIYKMRYLDLKREMALTEVRIANLTYAVTKLEFDVKRESEQETK